ncbi:hypothetical protein SLA2020_450240 [Shorea laevis]
MEQRADDPTTEEIEVAKILVELPQLILESDSRPRFPFSWGVRKKRSVPGIDYTPTQSLPPAKPSPPTPAAEAASPSLPGTVLVAAPTKKVDASSPATPLLFSPSESEEKPKPPKKNYSLKRRRDQQLQLIEELSQRKELLQKEVENVRSYHNKLKAYNLALKARKQQFTSSASGVWSAETQIGQPSANHHRQQHPPLFYQQPFIFSQTVQMAQISETSDNKNNSQLRYGQSSSSLLEGVRDKVGPTVIPDLNLSLEEETGLEYCEPIDLNRARAAQARLKRMQICKMKNSSPSCKPRVINR